MSSPSITKDLKPPTRSHFHSASTTPSFVEIRSSEPIHAMERVQATSRPCHYNRFPIRFVRRPPPSGTPPGLEQKCQPQTALMNWRWLNTQQRVKVFSLPRLGNRINTPF